MTWRRKGPASVAYVMRVTPGAMTLDADSVARWRHPRIHFRASPAVRDVFSVVAAHVKKGSGDAANWWYPAAMQMEIIAITEIVAG